MNDLDVNRDIEINNNASNAISLVNNAIPHVNNAISHVYNAT